MRPIKFSQMIRSALNTTGMDGFLMVLPAQLADKVVDLMVFPLKVDQPRVGIFPDKGGMLVLILATFLRIYLADSTLEVAGGRDEDVISQLT